jgi:hypothetical protein
VGGSGRRSGPGPGPAEGGPPTFGYGDLLALDLPTARPIVEGLVDRETGAILAGPPNVGKTWMLLAMGRDVAAGRPWLGRFPTVQGAVLYVDEESHLAGVKARVHMLEAAEPCPEDLPLRFAVGLGARLDAQAGAEVLDALLAQHRPVLTIVDSLTRVHGADENSAGQMADVFANAKALMRAHGTAFVFADHVRKRGLVNDPEEMLRGSTEKRAWPDCILAVEPDPAGPTSLVVRHVKARHGRRLDPFAVSLEVDEVGGSARLVHAGEARTDAVARGGDVVGAIHALKGQLGDDGADATTVAAWLGCHPDTVRRHASKLAAAGIVATRKACAGAKGGKPKDVYDVVGGQG